MSAYTQDAWMGLHAAVNDGIRARRELREAEAIAENYHELNMQQAYQVAIRSALDEFLHRLYERAGCTQFPTILTDDAMRDHIGKAGRAVYNQTKSWDRVMSVGTQMTPDASPDLLANLAPKSLVNERTAIANERATQIRVLEDQVAVLTAANQKLSTELGKAKQVSQERVNSEITYSVESSSDANPNEQANRKLKSELDLLTKQCAQHMAQAAAFRQQLQALDPTNPLISDAALRQRVADVAYSQLAATNFENWEIVKQVGASFVSTSEGARARNRTLI